MILIYPITTKTGIKARLGITTSGYGYHFTVGSKPYQDNSTSLACITVHNPANEKQQIPLVRSTDSAART